MGKLTFQEQMLVLSIATVFLVGYGVKAWRDAHRLPVPAVHAGVEKKNN